MTDPLIVTRLAKQLQAVSEATPRGEGYWAALADFAAHELERTVIKTPLPLPANPFIAILQQREGFSVPIAQATTLTDLAAKVATELDVRGEGQAWLVEVRKIVEVTG